MLPFAWLASKTRNPATASVAQTAIPTKSTNHSISHPKCVGKARSTRSRRTCLPQRNNQGAARKVDTYRMYSLISLAQGTEPQPTVRNPTSAQIITIMANSKAHPSRASASRTEP